MRMQKTTGAYEVWLEWQRPNQVYQPPRPNSVLPGAALRRNDTTPFDNAIEGRATIEATFKAETLIYLRGDRVHAAPALPGAKLTLTQPLPSRMLQKWKAGAKGCRTRTATESTVDSGWTAAVAVTPRKPGACVVTLTWRR